MVENFKVPSASNQDNRGWPFEAFPCSKCGEKHGVLHPHFRSNRGFLTLLGSDSGKMIIPFEGE